MAAHGCHQVSDPDKGVLGTGAHSDYGLMTMLATVGGLTAVESLSDKYNSIIVRNTPGYSVKYFIS